MTDDAASSDARLMRLIKAIALGNSGGMSALLAASPNLAQACLCIGASRQGGADSFLPEIKRYLYAGDTALHAAAAAYRHAAVLELVAGGADVRARNRRGAEPLHYAADGIPGSYYWDPEAQAATIACLIRAGADPNAADKSGVMPLHRAVRTSCAAAAKALLDAGADGFARNGNGSTPLDLASRNTGRGGSGTMAAKEQQAQILHLLNDWVRARG